MDYGCSSKLPKNDERQNLYKKQREERGFDDTETWNLDCTIMKFAIPRLKRFKEIKKCSPVNLTSDEWDNIIQEIIDGFEEYINNQNNDKSEKALSLFSKYFNDLWW